MFHGIDKIPVVAYATSQEPNAAGLKRFCDSKSNYSDVGSIAISIWKQLPSDKQKKITESIELTPSANVNTSAEKRPALRR